MSAVVLCLLLALAVGTAGCGGGDDEKTEEVPRTALVPGALDDTLQTSADTTAWKQMGGTGGDDARLLPGEGVTGDRGQPSGDGPEPEGEMTATTRPPDSSDGPPSLSSSAGGSGAYLLQLGSFSNLENARKQADRLRDNGYDPVLETSTLGGQTYHRVVLRGLPDKSAASALGERIHAELGITYLVRQNR
jgi:hypothetical protein